MKAEAIHSENIYIRLATASDVDLLLELSTNTFYEAFSQQNTATNMMAYMTSAFTKEQLAKELREITSVFLLAFLEGEVAGYAKLRKNTSHSAFPQAKAIEIHRLYVLKSMTGKKVGRALMEKCLEIARNEAYETVWLGVWEYNIHAIAFYKKWGFKVFSSHLFKLGNEEQTDYLMKKQLI